MSRHRHSRYIFETTGNTRTFLHQPYINDLSIECPSCKSVVGAHEPYSHHWLDAEDVQHIKLGLAEKLLLKRIERQNIDTFLLCDESPVGRTSDFLLEAGMQAVPQLLRFLNFEASWLEVTIGFYVNVTKQRMYYESCPVVINHFLDIDESVDMIFSLLVEKIYTYVMVKQRVPMEACTVKRVKVIVKRHWNGRLHLPLQYRVKCDTRSQETCKTTEIDLPLLTESFVNYHGQRFGQFPASLQVNLYCLRVCASTKELYAVPYLISNDDVSNTPTFLIQTDVAGEFRGMYEIRNVRRFLKADSKDHVYVCRDCSSHFSERSLFALHKQINCGRGFVVWDIEGETPELYENCLPLPKKFFKFAWYGIAS